MACLTLREVMIRWHTDRPVSSRKPDRLHEIKNITLGFLTLGQRTTFKEEVPLPFLCLGIIRLSRIFDKNPPICLSTASREVRLLRVTCYPVLIVGHSNTVPETILEFGADPPLNPIPHDDYHHLYYLTIPAKGKPRLRATQY